MSCSQKMGIINPYRFDRVYSSIAGWQRGKTFNSHDLSRCSTDLQYRCICSPLVYFCAWVRAIRFFELFVESCPLYTIVERILNPASTEYVVHMANGSEKLDSAVGKPWRLLEQSLVSPLASLLPACILTCITRSCLLSLVSLQPLRISELFHPNNKKFVVGRGTSSGPQDVCSLSTYLHRTDTIRLMLEISEIELRDTRTRNL